MKHLLLFIGLMLMPFCATYGQNPQGDSLNFGHVTETHMDSIFYHYDRPGQPGCAVAVMAEGEPIFAKGYGVANLDYNIPIRTDSRFMIASISKQVAAATLLMLEQEGHLDLDEDLRDYLPELPQTDRPVTTRQLMYHTSGIRDLFHLLFLADIGLDNTTTKERALELIKRQNRYNFKPGDWHLYSNSGYFLIATLVERITGMTLDEYSRKHLFNPLEMHHTHWHDDTGRIVPNRVISYRPRSYGPGRFYRDNLDRVGARGLVTTLEDFMRWEANFFENRTAIELFTEKMTRPGWSRNIKSLNYASGMRLGYYKKLRTEGHGGSYMGFRSHQIRFPDYGFTTILFCNQSDINPAVHARQIADLYLKDLFEQQFKGYPGIYRNEALQTGFEVILEEGDLYLVRLTDGRTAETQSADDDPGNTNRYGERESEPAFESTPNKQRMVWQENNLFETNDWELRFKRNSRGEFVRFTLQAPGTGSMIFEKKERDTGVDNQSF